MEDSSCKVPLEDAIRFAPEQQLEAYRQGNWQRVAAGDGSWRGSTPLMLINYRPLISTAAHPIGVWYESAQQLFVQHRDEWRLGVVQRNKKAQFDAQISLAKESLRKMNEAGALAQELSAEAKRIVLQIDKGGGSTASGEGGE